MSVNYLNHKQNYGGTQHMETARIFKTANRRLENFLFLHRIHFFDQKKNDDDMTEWYYIVTPQFRKVYQEYRELWGVNDRG